MLRDFVWGLVGELMGEPKLLSLKLISPLLCLSASTFVFDCMLERSSDVCVSSVKRMAGGWISSLIMTMPIFLLSESDLSTGFKINWVFWGVAYKLNFYLESTEFYFSSKRCGVYCWIALILRSVLNMLV